MNLRHATHHLKMVDYDLRLANEIADEVQHRRSLSDVERFLFSASKSDAEYIAKLAQVRCVELEELDYPEIRRTK